MEDLKPKIGMSACLAGQPVRFNGGSIAFDLLTILRAHFCIHPVCPEMAAGMGAPRESVRWERAADKLQLVGNKTGKNWTDAVASSSDELVESMPEIDGFILKRSSPTCGIERVKVYGKNGIPRNIGQGLFAQKLIARFPHLPVIEEGRLTDEKQRHHFFEQVFTHARYRAVKNKVSELEVFHRQHKFLIRKHSQRLLKELGQICAESHLDFEAAKSRYYSLLMQALKIRPSKGSQRDTAQHLMGYFKNQMSPIQKNAFLNILEQHADGLVTDRELLIAQKMMNDFFPDGYLGEQIYFEPFPRSLVGNL